VSCANATHGPAVEAPYFATFVEGRRGEILDAALVVFTDKGYEAGTMREIAARVGVTEPAIYRHYAGKEALLIDLVTTAGDRIVTEVNRRLSEVQPISLRSSLANMLHMRRRDASDNRWIMRTLIDAAPHNESMKATFREHFGAPMVDSIRRFVPRVDAFFGIARPVDDLDPKVRAFMSLFVGYFMTSMFFEHQTDDDAMVDAMLAIMDWDRAE
jgi:AcrR family transcriptional regulator